MTREIFWRKVYKFRVKNLYLSSLICIKCTQYYVAPEYSDWFHFLHCHSKMEFTHSFSSCPLHRGTRHLIQLLSCFKARKIMQLPAARAAMKSLNYRRSCEFHFLDFAPICLQFLKRWRPTRPTRTSAAAVFVRVLPRESAGDAHIIIAFVSLVVAWSVEGGGGAVWAHAINISRSMRQ